MTILAGSALIYLTVVEHGPGWLRALFVAFGLAGTPFWLFVGLLGAWAGGPSAWTICLALIANVIAWGAPFYACVALARRVRGRGASGGLKRGEA
jgi:hypothetical protein